MDHILFQHTSQQIHRLPLQAHIYLGFKIAEYNDNPAGRTWNPAHRQFVDESVDRFKRDDRYLRIEEAKLLP